MPKRVATPKKAEPSWKVQTGDCRKLMEKLDPSSVSLCFADPPFNINRAYTEHDGYDDKKSDEEYLAWSARWMGQVHDVLEPTGTFWLAIGDKYVSELDVLAKSLGFHKRSHVIWLYSFGVNCARNFTKSHTHLLYYTKHKTKLTFNDQDPLLRIPSARQLLYNDKRANPKGRLPDDTWILLPQQLEKMTDTWLESRLCGTFNERVEGVDNQMPLPILDRIIRATSLPGDLVLDPFLGSGTTGCSAALWGRRFLGYELSPTCAKKAQNRIRTTMAKAFGTTPKKGNDAPKAKRSRSPGAVR